MCTEPNPECHYVSQVSRDFKACKLCRAAGPAREIRISATRFLSPDPSQERVVIRVTGRLMRKVCLDLSLWPTYFRPEDLVGNLTFHHGSMEGGGRYIFVRGGASRFQFGSLNLGKKFQSQIYFHYHFLLLSFFFSIKTVDEIFLRQKQNGSRLIDMQILL